MKDTKRTQFEQDQSWPMGTMLKDYLRGAVRQAIYGLLEEELTGLCGPLHRPEASSGYYRAGSAPSHIFVEGRREELLRPRVRVRTGAASAEVELQSWKAARRSGSMGRDDDASGVVWGQQPGCGVPRSR